MLAVLVAAPWQWAEQGMVVNEQGVGFERRRLWWAPERRGFVRWDDVLGTAVRAVARESSEDQDHPILEVYLTGLDESAPFPGWVRRVRAGEALWGEATDVARLVVPVVDPRDRSKASLLLDQARPGPSGHAPTVFAGPRSTYWIPVRRRWVLPALMAAVAPIAVSAGLVASAIMIGPAAPGEWTWTLGLAVAGLALGAWLLPPLCARQGIGADDDGLHLVQEPLLWFRGRSVRVRWKHVRTVRQGTALSLSSLVDRRGGVTAPVTDLVVDRAHAPARTPRWARVSGTEPDTVRIRLCPGAEQHALLVQATRGRVG